MQLEIGGSAGEFLLRIRRAVKIDAVLADGVFEADAVLVRQVAHVVGDAKEVQLKAKGGALRKADVLWANKANDIALLRTSSAGLGSANLVCRSVKAGDAIVAYGNPLKIEFVAAYGKIAGDPRETGPWKSVYVTDITTVMGQSGGPVYADNGDLIGITVGVMAAPIGFSGSLVGYGYVVPSTAVCELLARK